MLKQIKDNIKFAVVGCGHIGKRHAEMISQNVESELVALCDIKPKEELGIQMYDHLPFFSTIDELLDSCLDFDVVNICTPNGFHAEYSIKVLEHQKHLLCEKPLALTKQDAENVIYKALQMSKIVFTVMQNRYSPPSVWIKDVIDHKILGDIFMVQINCYWNRDARYYKKDGWKGKLDLDGGTLFTQFSHFIDLMYWLFGDIKDIESKFSDFNHQDQTDFEDSGTVHFKLVNGGGLGSLNFSTAVWDQNFESSITIVGSNGTVKLGGQYMNVVEYCHIKDYILPELAPVNEANDYGTYKGSAANHHYVIENVVDTLKGRTRITTNALEGLKVVEIIERIYEQRKEFLENKIGK